MAQEAPVAHKEGIAEPETATGDGSVLATRQSSASAKQRIARESFGSPSPDNTVESVAVVAGFSAPSSDSDARGPLLAPERSEPAAGPAGPLDRAWRRRTWRSRWVLPPPASASTTGVPVVDFSHELLDQAHFVVAPDHGDIGTPARGQSLARGARSVGCWQPRSHPCLRLLNLGCATPLVGGDPRSYQSCRVDAPSARKHRVSGARAAGAEWGVAHRKGGARRPDYPEEACSVLLGLFTEPAPGSASRT